MVRRLSSFQTLALWTTGTTYFLILVGGLVRASGAGLGCPDWPRCFGSWIPPASAAELPPGFAPSQFNATLMWTEYLNRLLGVSVGLLIFATLISAWRHHRDSPRVVWPVTAAFLLVGLQGWLGGVVVQQELAAWLVTLHMIVALVIVSLLLYATAYSVVFLSTVPTSAGSVRAPAPRDSRTDGGQGVVAWAPLALILVTLLQVVLGTQVRERVDLALDGGVARSAALATVGRYDFLHRDVALLVLASTIAVVWLIASRHRDERALVAATAVMAALVMVQMALGLTMAYAALTPAAQVAHLTVSSLLLGAQTMVFLLARWGPRGEAGSRSRSAAGHQPSAPVRVESP